MRGKKVSVYRYTVFVTVKGKDQDRCDRAIDVVNWHIERLVGAKFNKFKIKDVTIDDWEQIS